MTTRTWALGCTLLLLPLTHSSAQALDYRYPAVIVTEQMDTWLHDNGVAAPIQTVPLYRDSTDRTLYHGQFAAGLAVSQEDYRLDTSGDDLTLLSPISGFSVPTNGFWAGSTIRVSDRRYDWDVDPEAALELTLYSMTTALSCHVAFGLVAALARTVAGLFY